MALQTLKHFAFTCVLGKVMNPSLRLAHDTDKHPGRRRKGAAGRANVKVASSAMLAMLALSVVGLGAGRASAQPQPKPKVVETNPGAKVLPILLEQQKVWRRSMLQSPRPKKGCFTATYPATKWQEAKCGTPPNRPYKPRGGIRPFTVGNGVDFSAEVTGNTSQAEGSFDSVTTTGENDGGTANSFSLQLNTNFFSTTTCAGASVPANCQGWEQFIYASDFNSVFIQYWMISFNNPCPAGWNTFGGDCWRNSTNSATPPAQTIAALGSMVVNGAVAGVGGNADDAVSFTVGATVFSASGDNVFPDLTNGWRISEFNVVGDGGGSAADFNAATTITVRTAVNSGMGAVPPTCDQVGFTGETNNLTLVTAPALINDATWPSIVFTETNNAPTPISCDNADSIGDTHLKTFAGLYYDFQASGDFVLAENGPNFLVQARQASGAPTWPNASLNKGIAMQLGQTRVAVYVEPDRLFIDGRSENLADGKDLLLSTGVQVSRRGNLYVVSSQDGNSVRAELNGVYINADVGLGRGAQQPRGLLGNPNRNVNQLATSNGVILTEPVAFTDLYHGYADSWRVQPNQSLFTEATTIKAGIPSGLFFASQLNAQELAHARAVCTAAHITNKTLFDSCTLDTAVLNDEKAAKVFITTRPPLHVVTPVLRATRLAANP